MVTYHELGWRHLPPSGFLMRPLLNGGTLARRAKRGASQLKMLSAYGWVIVRSSRAGYAGADAAACDELDDLADAADEKLFAALEAFLRPIVIPDLDWSLRRQMNNERGILMLSSSRNHRSGRPTVLQVLDWLAEHGPGSYGLIYLHDDEDGRTGPASGGGGTIDFREHYRVWRLRDGRIDELDDPFLSPRDNF